MPPPGKRIDPYTAFHFLVAIDGIISAGFTEVSGLSVQTEVTRKTFGGENDKEYKFITGTKFSDLVLKRGLTDMELWNWYKNISSGKIERKNGSVHLRNQAGETIMQWDFYEGLPIKWDGPTFNAGSNTIATESMTITHHGLVKSK